VPILIFNDILTWSADEWASHSPPQTADATIPPGVPCARLANLVLAPKEEAKRIASYVPRWGIRLAAHLLESKAWAIYRERQKRYASLIGDRELVVLYKQIPGMGRAKGYIITIADDDRAPLDKLCKNMIAAGSRATCCAMMPAIAECSASCPRSSRPSTFLYAQSELNKPERSCRKSCSRRGVRRRSERVFRFPTP
jgi:hypothetical protein